MTDNNSQAQILSVFIQLEKQARLAVDVDELGFTLCNNTKKLLPYQQAIFFRMRPIGIHIQTISATATLNQDAPYIVWLNKLIKHTANSATGKQLSVLDKANYPESIVSQWQEWLPAEILWCPFVDKQQQLVGGLVFTREQQWHQHETTLLGELMNAYTHAWINLIKQQSPLLKKISVTKNKKWFWGAVATVFMVMLLPIRQSVLAPGEIAAHKPEVISVSVDGVIQKIVVEPNQKVKKGQELFRLDPITFENQYEQAEKNLQVAVEKYRKAYQQAFNDPDSKAELPILSAEVEKSRAEVTYSKKLLKRITIHAPSDGVIIYSDPKDWISKPVKVGERIMLVANPRSKELDIELPVSDAIDLDKNQAVKFFLNVTPLKPIYAKLRYISYSASTTPQDTLVYHLKADFNLDQDIPRIGLKGTATVYGRNVTVFYYLFWRPISFIRRTLGV